MRIVLVILLNKFPKKLMDPGYFMLLCLIGNLNVENALAGLGTNINLQQIPSSM